MSNGTLAGTGAALVGGWGADCGDGGGKAGDLLGRKWELATCMRIGRESEGRMVVRLMDYLVERERGERERERVGNHSRHSRALR